MQHSCQAHTGPYAAVPGVLLAVIVFYLWSFVLRGTQLWLCTIAWITRSLQFACF